MRGEEGGSLHELVRERLSRLDLDGIYVMRWAALLAPRIDAASLARVTGLDSNRVGEILESAERLALLLPAECGSRFSHELVTRCVYNDISPARRRGFRCGRGVRDIVPVINIVNQGTVTGLAVRSLQWRVTQRLVSSVVYTQLKGA
jgi:hypothetical protein